MPGRPRWINTGRETNTGEQQRHYEDIVVKRPEVDPFSFGLVHRTVEMQTEGKRMEPFFAVFVDRFTDENEPVGATVWRQFEDKFQTQADHHVFHRWIATRIGDVTSHVFVEEKQSWSREHVSGAAADIVILAEPIAVEKCRGRLPVDGKREMSVDRVTIVLLACRHEKSKEILDDDVRVVIGFEIPIVIRIAVEQMEKGLSHFLGQVFVTVVTKVRQRLDGQAVDFECLARVALANDEQEAATPMAPCLVDWPTAFFNVYFADHHEAQQSRTILID
jgi:hypothetical protein